MLPWIIEVKTQDEIAKMKKAGRLARELLDLGGSAIEPGITTDAIDAIVHEECIKVRQTERDRERESACQAAMEPQKVLTL